MRKIIKNNYKFIFGIVVGLIISVSSVYAIDAYIESKKVSYDNHNKTITAKENVQEAIDELYERSGIHKEKWVDSVLNGADPVLKDPLIPVEIKPNGEVYYANINSEWYNYKEKRWANAVILTDTASKYTVGQHILEKDIESYFVWIPRYQYKVWDMGNYTSVITLSQLKDSEDDAKSEYALWKIARSNTRIIDIKFGNVSTIPKMAESAAKEGEYYTHPAFTLGGKNLNGIWVGKFDVGGTSAETMVVKPNVIIWRNANVKTFFDASKGYENGLDSHMMRNTEWGAVAYLSHSAYGIGGEININNNSDLKTGYSSYNSAQNSHKGITGNTDDVTQPWNSPTGYLASTTGNITGIYDINGGAVNFVAGCIEGTPLNSGFDEATLASEMEKGYIDKYDLTSTISTYNKRILGDATGELGPFFSYFESTGVSYYHNNWYTGLGCFLDKRYPWFLRGGLNSDGGIGDQFYFNRTVGSGDGNIGFSIVLDIS